MRRGPKRESSVFSALSWTHADWGGEGARHLGQERESDLRLAESRACFGLWFFEVGHWWRTDASEIVRRVDVQLRAEMSAASATRRTMQLTNVGKATLDFIGAGSTAFGDVRPIVPAPYLDPPSRRSCGGARNSGRATLWPVQQGLPVYPSSPFYLGPRAPQNLLSLSRTYRSLVARSPFY